MFIPETVKQRYLCGQMLIFSRRDFDCICQNLTTEGCLLLYL